MSSRGNVLATRTRTKLILEREEVTDKCNEIIYLGVKIKRNGGYEEKINMSQQVKMVCYGITNPSLARQPVKGQG